MFGSQRQVAAVGFSDPTADKYIPILRAPADSVLTIEGGGAATITAVAASTANYVTLTLLNGGAKGTAVTALSDAIGGTAGWAANTDKDFTVVDGSGKLAAGEWLVAKYDEEGTVAPGTFVVSVEYVCGLGAKA